MKTDIFMSGSRKMSDEESKKISRDIIKRHKSGQKVHTIANAVNMSELEVMRVIKSYEKNKDKDGMTALKNVLSKYTNDDGHNMTAIKNVLPGIGDNKKPDISAIKNAIKGE